VAKCFRRLQKRRSFVVAELAPTNVLDDCAIDYLEQTLIESLDPDNILDAEGIKKITDLTAAQAKLSNNVQRDKEKVIKQLESIERERVTTLKDIEKEKTVEVEKKNIQDVICERVGLANEKAGKVLKQLA